MAPNLAYAPHRLQRLPALWFSVSTILVLWDLLRPRTLPGGSLHWLYRPYELYSVIDYVYGVPYMTAGFPRAQSFNNVIESALNILYLVLAWKGDPLAVLIGFAALVATFSKTVLYWANEHYSGYVGVGHNDLKTLIPLYLIPNGLWLVVPSILIYFFGRDITRSLRYSAAKSLERKGS